MKSKILVIDDSPSIRRLVQSALTEAGYPVSIYDGGAAALAAIRNESFDVVVTDLNMPDMDGIALTRAIRSLANTSKLQILILTTDNSATRKQEAKLAGASGWLLKPFNEKTLLGAIRRVTERQGVAS